VILPLSLSMEQLNQPNNVNPSSFFPHSSLILPLLQSEYRETNEIPTPTNNAHQGKILLHASVSSFHLHA